MCECLNLFCDISITDRWVVLANDKCRELPGCQKSIILVTRSICQPWPNHHLQPPPRPLAVDMKMSFNLQSLKKLVCLHKMFNWAWHFLIIFSKFFIIIWLIISHLKTILSTIVLWLCVIILISRHFPFFLTNIQFVWLGISWWVSSLVSVSMVYIHQNDCCLLSCLLSIHHSHLTRQSIKCVKWVFMYGWIVAIEWWITPLTGKIQVS